MRLKIGAGVVAVILFLGYLLPPVFKPKDFALGVVIILGVSLMLLDLIQSMKSKEKPGLRPRWRSRRGC